MVNLIDCTVKKFKKNIEDKKIILFGAGTFGEYAISALDLADRIAAVVDNNRNKTKIHDPISGKEFPIISLEELTQLKIPIVKDKVAILITPAAAMADIVEQLDFVDILNKIDCYLLALLRQNIDETEAFTFYQGKTEIPKIIHYFWLGGREIPDELKRYMDTWGKCCPDYTFIKWDESNYDFSKNRYMKEAYESHMWGFVPDYARLDVIYEQGGIYLDTDVELIKSLDRLRDCGAFFGFADDIEINTGSGFGAIPHHPMIKDMMIEYDQKSFFNKDGKLNIRPCVFYQNPVFIKWGFDPFCGKYQEKEGVVIYPSEVLSPYGCSIMGYRDDIKRYSDFTIGIHRNFASWIGEDVKDEKKSQLSRIINRIEVN